MPPPGETLLDLCVSKKRDVFGVGKISDIFTGRGVTKVLKAPDNESQFNRTLEAICRGEGRRPRLHQLHRLRPVYRAIAATSPAMPRAWRNSTAGCRS